MILQYLLKRKLLSHIFLITIISDTSIGEEPESGVTGMQEDKVEDEREDGQEPMETPSTSAPTGKSKKKKQRTLNYTCEKCNLETKSSREYLYHYVKVHSEEMNIYACDECDYCTKYKHKIFRHYKDIHQRVVPIETIEAEFSNLKPRSMAVTTTIVKKKGVRKPIMSKHGSKKLMVRFRRPKEGKRLNLPAPAAKTSKASPTSKTKPQMDHLSRVVEEIIGDDGKPVFKCRECQFTSGDKQNVAKHAVSWHVDTKSFSCNNCDYITFDKSDLIAHNITHRNEHQFVCNECTYSTDFRSNFDRHVQYHEGTFPHKCAFCSFSCGTEKAKKRHEANNHEPIPPAPKKIKLQAPKPVATETVTAEVTSDEENMEDDLDLVNEAENVHPVKETGKSTLFPSNPNIFFDPSSASMVPRMTLPPPSMESASLLDRETSPVRKLPPNITRYVEKFNGKLVCPVCKLKYKRSSDLNRHMKGKHGCKLREYLENISDEGEFLAQLERSSASMDTSVTSNPGHVEEEDDDDDILIKLEKPSGKQLDNSLDSPEDLQCKYCTYKATWPSDLKRHLQSHSLEKRYKCSDCAKKYKYRSDLNVHIRKDHNKEPSDVKIVRVATMLKKKSSPSIFKCPCCTYASRWKSEIDRHSRMHNSEKTFQCLHCEYQTFWRGDIRRHVYKKHNEIMTEGVALNDVIIMKKELAPQVVRGKKAEETNLALSSDSEAYSSRETTPVKTGPVRSHEGSPEVNMSDYVTKTTAGHSPTPSPIKDLGNGLYKCQYCGFEANAPSKMNAHIATHTNLKRYMCPVCGRRANWKWDIAKHIRKDHNDQVTQVIKLSKKEAEDTIQAYIEEHPTLKRDHHLNFVAGSLESETMKDQFYKCSMCDFSAEKRISVSRHLRSMHEGYGGSVILVKKTQVAKAVSSPPQMKSILPPQLQPDQAAQPSATAKLVENFGPQDALKPFMCSECGKRGASKGDVKKHYHYAHADKEIRIIYLGDGSQSVYAAKTDSGPSTPEKPVVAEKTSPVVEQTVTVMSPEVMPESVSPKPHQASKHPKVLGYIKPFVCGLCGRRSNWRWDVNRHIRERHPGRKDIRVIELTEEEARATYNEYMKNQLPELNKVSNSVPKKRHRVSVPDLGTGTLQTQAVVPSFSLVPVPSTPAISSQPVFPQAFVISPTSSPVMVPNIPVIGTNRPSSASDGSSPQKARMFKQYKCAACSYRSNYRSDIQRHMVRRHGLSKAKVIVLDRDIAQATLASYRYNKNAVDRGEDPGVSNSAPSTPLPPKAWEGLEKKIWKCSMCSYSNEAKVDVLKHLGKHNMKNHKCTECNWTSNFRSAVLRHIQAKHGSNSKAQCKLSIKLIKEGPGVDQSGRFIMPKGVGMTGNGESLTGTGDVPVAVTGQESMRNPQSMMTTAVYHCKVCSFSSSWRSCICRHLNKMHNIKDYCANIVKKIVRTSKSYNQNAASSSGVMTSPPGTPRKEDAPHHSKPKNFSCKICPYRTYKGKMLKFHMTCHKPQPGVKQVKCKYCPYYVSSNRLLSQHLNLHMQDFKMSQEMSYPVTPEKSTTPLSSSSKSPMQSKRHRCQKCPYTTNSKNDFLYHKQFHRPKPTADYKCDYCDYWVSHRRLIKQHMKVHTECADYDPDAVSPSKLDYSENSLVYDTIEIAAIKQKIIASKILPNLSQSPLVSPMKIASSCSVGGRRGFLRKDGSYRKIHQCRHCPYMNIRLRNMKLHEMMHGKRTATHPLMKCIHCDYYVGSKGLLAHHMKVHQEDYGVEFLEHGQKLERSDSMASEESEADSSISLERKVDTLLEITRFKKYGCEKCPYATSKRSRFQHHVELHGSKQKCKCDFCDYSVPTMNLLNQHMRLHFEPNQNLLAAQSILNLQYLPEMPADVALASMVANNNAKNPVSITHDHIDLYENQPEDMEPKKLYRCDRCPYANVRRDNLLAHLRCHMMKNEFACPYCDYSVGKTHVLVQHVKVHFSPLPELSEWLTENGNTERLKETKCRDMEEVVEVVKLFQSEKKARSERKEQKTDKVEEKGDLMEIKDAGKDGKDNLEKPGVNEKVEDKMETDGEVKAAVRETGNPEVDKAVPSTSKADTDPTEGPAKQGI